MVTQSDLIMLGLAILIGFIDDANSPKPYHYKNQVVMLDVFVSVGFIEKVIGFFALVVLTFVFCGFLRHRWVKLICKNGMKKKH